MSDPIFVLGCHRSGTSVVAGLLYHAAGVSMGDLMPPTADNPRGYYEALGVVEAHRDLLRQMERDWTCPPNAFRPGQLDLSALEEQFDAHKQLPGVWAMKDPRTMFLLPAWRHLGLERVRLVAVARPPMDTARSIEKRDGVRGDRAEAIVEAYLHRLAEIADKVPLPVIRFPGDESNTVVDQVRRLAESLELPWDADAAQAFFDPMLVRNRAPSVETSPAYEALLERAKLPQRLQSSNLRTLRLSSEPDWPLETHLGVRYAQQRNELWEMANFSARDEPDVVEVVLEGARPGGPRRPGVNLHQVQVTTPLSVGSSLLKQRLRPHAIIAHGLISERSVTEIEFFFRSVYVGTDALGELLIDVPDPRGGGLLSSLPPPPAGPRPARVAEIADRCGWDHVTTNRLSPGRSGMFFRKRILTDRELVPVVTDLIANLQRLDAINERLTEVEARIGNGSISQEHASHATTPSLEEVIERALTAERALDRLRNRRSVRVALALSRPLRGVFRTVRSWKKRP